MEHILIIGGGIGGALAHDLVLRGYRVTLLEKGELLSGASGRHHGLLHSGARYVLHDPDTARECFRENQILRQLAPEGLEQNDGLFVALDDADMSYWDRFINGCHDIGMPITPLSPSEALEAEPYLNPTLKAAVRVPDAVMDAWRLPLHFFATARANGADIRTYTEVIAILKNGSTANGLRVVDHRTHCQHTIHGDMVVNAAGPWAGRIAAMLGIHLPVRPAPGVMVAVKGRMADGVINRLHPADDGDIIVPQRQLSLLGTTAWLSREPDTVTTPRDHVDRIVALAAHLIPRVADLPRHAAWSAARPLVVENETGDPTKISRSFKCIHHEPRDGVSGFISVIGGKATIMRAMAEKSADLICRILGRDRPCRTAQSPLLNHRHYFRT